MSRFRQSTQVYNSNTYDDQTVIPSVGAASSYELTISTSNLELDMNNLRTLFSHVVSGSNGAFGSEPWYQGLSGRGVNTIDTDLESLENKTVLCRVSQDVDITVAPSDDHVVLSAPAQTPSQAIAIGNGIVTLPGAVVAQLAGAVGTASIDSVAASNAAAPKNLCILIDANTGDVLEDASNNQIFGLLQVGSLAVDGGAFDNANNAAQISFVTFDLGTNAFVLSAIPAGITDIRYAYVTRNTLEAVPEDCFLGFNSFVDGAASVDVTLTNAYANQGTTPAPLATNIFSQVPAAATNRSWSVTDSSANNIASFGTGAAATDLEVILGTAAVGVNSATTINGDDLDINVANAMTVENGALFEGGTANLSVNTAGNGNIDSDDSLFIGAATNITATATAGNITATATAGSMNFTSQTGTAISSDGNVTISANESSGITLDTQQDPAGASGDINLTTGVANIGATQSSGDVNITTGDAGTGAVGNIQLEAGSNTSAGPVGGNIVLKSGDNLTASTVLIPRLLVRSSDAANVVDGQSVQLLTYENQSAGTGGGRNASVFVGNIAPSHNAQGGSIFHFSSAASDGALYINTSTGVGNTWEQVLTSSSGALTLQAAYEGGNPVTPAGNTIVTTGGSAFDVSGTEDVTLTGESRNLLGYTGTTAPAPTDGVFLATNGTGSTIAEVSTLPTDTNSAQIQAFTGSTTGTGESGFISIFTGASEELSGNLTLSTGDATNSLAGSIELTAGSSTNGTGGDVIQTAGDSGGGNPGGNFSISSGAADSAGGGGGLMQVLGGNALNALSTGGNVQVTAGSNPLGTGGSALITGGNGSIAGGTGGDVRLTPGAGATPGVVEVSTLQAETATVLRMTNTVESIDHFVSAATPEGAIAGPQGSLAYVDTGAANGGELYLKVDGVGVNGWEQLLTAGSSALTLQAAYEGGNAVNPAGNTIVTTGGSALQVSGTEDVILSGSGSNILGYTGTTNPGANGVFLVTNGTSGLTGFNNLPTDINSAAIDLQTGSVSGIGESGRIDINTGGASGSGNVGSIIVGTGQHTGSGPSGPLTLETGANSGTGPSGTARLQTGNSTAAESGGLLLSTGNGGTTSGVLSLSTGDAAGSSGNIVLTPGDSSGAPAGATFIFGGNSGGASDGGGVAITGGTGGPSGGEGGRIVIQAGAGGSTTGDGADVEIDAGSATTAGLGGNVILRAGNEAGGNDDGRIRLLSASGALDQTKVIAEMQNFTTGGQSFQVYAGAAVPTHDAETGSLFSLDNGSTGALYVNDSLGGSGTSWSQLLTAASISLTLQGAYDGGATIGTTGNTIDFSGTAGTGGFTVSMVDAVSIGVAGGSTQPLTLSNAGTGSVTLEQTGIGDVAISADNGTTQIDGRVNMIVGYDGTATPGAFEGVFLVTNGTVGTPLGFTTLLTNNDSAPIGLITGNTTGNGVSGDVRMVTGDSAAAAAGDVVIETGDSASSTAGTNIGNIDIICGDNAASDTAGFVTITAGDNTDVTGGDGGNVVVTSGASAAGNAGVISLIPAAGGGNDGRVEVLSGLASTEPVIRYNNTGGNSGSLADVFSRDSTPEGFIAANPGSICHVDDGGPGGTGAVYVKESGTGNTGWSQLATGGSTLTRTYFDGIIGFGGVPASTDILAGNISTTLTGAFPGTYGTSQADFDATFEVYINGQKLVNNGPGGGQVTRNVGGTAISLNFQLFAGDTIAIVSYT